MIHWGLWVLINHFPLVSAAGKTLFAGRALGCIPVQIGLGMARKALKGDIIELRKHVEYWPAGHSVSMGCSTIISITVEVQIGPDRSFWQSYRKLMGPCKHTQKSFVLLNENTSWCSKTPPKM